MKKKNLKIFSAIFATLLILCIGSLLYTPQIAPPANMQSLDLTSVSNISYLNEANYAEEMQQLVLPYIESYKQTGYFTSFDQSQIYYEQYLLNDSAKHIVISHGFTETTQKYQEVIYYFLKQGYSVSILDHRSHGNSQRYTDDSSKIHITDFTDFVEDLKTFMDTIVVTNQNTDYFLFAHSMGGAIGSLFVEQYPDYFKAAVLSSPMMEIETGSYPVSITKLIANTFVCLGLGENYIFGQGPFNTTLNFEASAATSEKRYLYYMNEVLNNEALQMSGASFNWLQASLKATHNLIKNAPSADLPILLFQAENDTFVRRGGQYQFVKNAPNATLVYVESAKHELYYTTNDTLIPYFNTIFAFYEEQLSK